MNERKQKICAYDIETIARPLPDSVIDELCKTGNLKDPAKIKEKQAEFRGKLGVDPLTAMPCCGGWYASDDDCGYIMLKDTTPEAEATFLREYWAKLAEFDILVGFNSIAFDSRILLLRSAVHGLDIPFKMDRKKYSTNSNHLDLYAILTDWAPFGQGKLSFFLSMMGLEGKTEGLDGSMVQDYFNEELFEDIGAYCLQDAKQTFELFEKIRRYFL